MFDLVLEQAKQSGASKVSTINLVIGEMTGVVGDSVRFYLEILGKDSIAEGAAVNIKNIPAQARCHDCQKEFVIAEYQWICPACGSINLEITGGKELFIESIEVN